MTVPRVVAKLLRGRPDVGDTEQAFPFLTVDDAGYPHVALLSRSEIDVTDDEEEVSVAVASQRTRHNLDRDGRAGLVMVGGSTAHYLKLRMVRSFEQEGMLGCAFEVVEHKADSIGIPLNPLAFMASEHVATTERWGVSERVLATVNTGDGRG